MRKELRNWGTDRKQVEESLSQRNQCFKLKLENNLSHSQRDENLELAEIIDVQAVQSLMDDFYKFAHITMALLDLKGNILVSIGWQDICTRFHRVHPETCKHCVESDTKLSSGVPPGEFKLYKCKNNMWDIVTPIMAGGQHIGNIFSGQFFFEDEPVDYELFRSQARQYGFDEEEYIAALEKVPRLSRDTVEKSMSFFMKLANMISQLGHSNIKLSQAISERDALVDELQESEERFRSVLENSLDSAYRLDLRSNCFDYMSPVIEQITGFSAKEINAISRNGLLDRIHPDDRPLVVAGTAQSLDEGFGIHEYRFKCKDGRYRWLADRFSIIKDKSGMARFRAGFTRDITESKQTEEALKNAYNLLEEKVKERTAELEKAYNLLKESERSLAEAQKLAHIGNWDRSLITNEVHWSDQAYRIFGFEPQEFSVNYDLFLSRVHPDDQDHVIKGAKQALEKKLSGIDYRIVLDNGEERIVHEDVKVVFDEENIPVQLRGTIQDITENKKAEKKLKDSEEKYRNIVETANEGIGIIDNEFKLTFVNKKLEDMIGYSAEEIIGKPIWFFLSEESKHNVNLILERGLQEFENPELRFIRKDGSPLWAQVNAKTILDSDGKFKGIMTMLSDINKRKEAEESLAKIEIARKREIHHRIKNNLQVISSLLDLQGEKFKGRKNLKDSEVLEAFRESQNRVISMALIHEELYKGEELETLNFSLYIKELAENLFNTYKLENIDITLKMDLEEEIFFDMDTAVPLGMVVNELISNSFKYAFPDREKGEIQIKLSSEESKGKTSDKDITGKNTIYTLTVADNGIGIPESIDIENPETLGLQLVNILADQLDGKIELKRNKGTEFKIMISL